VNSFAPNLEFEPVECANDVVFTCRYVSGPYDGPLDLCDFENTNGEYTSTGTFDETTGQLDFVTADSATFPPGDYEFQIYTAVGDYVYDSPFILRADNPCKNAKLTLLEDPFGGMVIDYDLFDPAMEFPYDLDSIGESSTAAFCGKPMIRFVENLETNELSALFIPDYEAEKFVIFTTDWDAYGIYYLRFKYYFENDPTIYEVSGEFSVVIHDMCYEVVPMLIKPDVPPQVYTITDDPLTINIPSWRSEPYFCAE
jgi:hypothetical protein